MPGHLYSQKGRRGVINVTVRPSVREESVMGTVQDITGRELELDLGIPEAICNVFLHEVQQRAPAATLSIRRGTYPHATVLFSSREALVLVKRNGFHTIACFPGLVGSQYFALIPRSSVSNGAAVRRFQQKFPGTEVVEDANLPAALSMRMAPIYERLDST
jgi:hypothetical protein